MKRTTKKWNTKLILFQLFFLQAILFSKILFSRVDNDLADNMRVRNTLTAGTLDITGFALFEQNALVTGNLGVNGSTTIRGNLTVTGTINGGSGGTIVSTQLPVNANEIACFVDNTGSKIKGSPVTIDNSGNINGANTIELVGIKKAGNTVTWPSGTGAAGTYLGSDGLGNLIYGTPVGSGDVTALAPFVTNDRILTTANTVGTTIKQSNVTLDSSSNISGVNTLTANNVNTNNITITGGGNIIGNVIGNLTGNVTGNVVGDVLGTLTGNVIGSASLNVLKAGDTMTGNLTMANTAINLQNFAATGAVSLQAPAVNTSYTLNMPANPPLTNQFFQVVGAASPYTTQWTTIDASPAVNRYIYVTKGGNDANDGSFSAPLLTVKQAVINANTFIPAPSTTNPVVISVGPGTFTEANPIVINNDAIAIVGSSIADTIISPSNPAAILFNTTKTNLTFENFTIQGTTAASGFSLASTTYGNIRFNSVSFILCKTGLNLSATGTPPTVFLENTQFAGSGTTGGACIAINNMPVIIKNGIFRGPLGGAAANTAITLTGDGTHAYISDSTFLLYETGISVAGLAKAHILSSVFESTKTGGTSIACIGGSKTQIIGCNFVLNSPSTTNVNVSGSGTKTYIEGCLFDCEDSTPAPQGTSVKCVAGAEVILNNSTLDEAVIGIACGQAGDLVDTAVIASGVTLRECTNCIIQTGTSTLHFTSGSFDEDTMIIDNSTNVVVGSFDDDGALAFGNNQDLLPIPVYKVSTGQPSSPTLNYYPNFYGSKGTVYINPNADQTLNATVAQGNDASYYVITGNNASQAKIDLISDTSNIGTGDNVRGWEISKLGGANANLAFTYSDNDPALIIGANAVMQLDGSNNIVKFPVATNAPTPTNTVAQLEWAGDTNLYRSAANTLKTDDSFVIGTGGTLTVPVGTAALPSIIFPTAINTGIYSSAAYNLSLSTSGVQRMNVSPTGIVSIASLSPTGVVHNDNSGNLSTSLIFNSDIAIGTIADNKLSTTVTNTNTPNSIVLRDGSGDFSAHAITATGAAGYGFFGPLTGNVTGNATTATTALSAGSFTGNLAGDVSGPQGSTVVNIVGGQLASAVAAAATGVAAATELNTPLTLVKRDGSGDFKTHAIIATGAAGYGFFGPLTGNVTGNATTATTATNAAYADASATFTTALTGDVIGGNSLNPTTVVSIGSGAKTAAQVIQATDLALSATSMNVAGTIVKRDLSGNFITNMITLNTADIINPSDATTKDYVDTQVTLGGIVPKTPVLVVSTTDVSPVSGTTTIDGVSVVATNRVLLQNQANGVQNGIWEVQAGPWSRPADFASGDAAGKAYVLTTTGIINAGSSWICSTPLSLIDTDTLMFVQFSSPSQTTAANVGSGAGRIFRDKTGQTINLKSLLALSSYVTITNNTDTIDFNSNATPNNVASTIVARDASGYFSATGMTGAASLNVLKAGDTMTGPLYMGATGTRQPVRFRDNNVSGNYVGIQAPAAVGTSYTIDLPANAPVAGQFLQAVTSTLTTWTTVDSPPATTRTFYVTLAGSDLNDGSFSFPYRHVKYAVTQANAIASLSTPVVVNVGPGVFIEDNSGSPISITNSGVSIVGSSLASTIIIAGYYNNDLFDITTPNVEFYDLILRSTGVSAKSAVHLVTTTDGRARFNSVGVSTFDKAFEISSSVVYPLIIFNNVQCIDNATCIWLNNVQASIQSSIFQGSSLLVPSNTGIHVQGSNSQVIMISDVLRIFNTAVEVTGGNLRASAVDTESALNGFVFTGGKGFLTGINNILNLTNSVNILVHGLNTEVYVEGSLFECDDASYNAAGTCLKIIDGGIMKASNNIISDALIGIECGQTSDVNQASIAASSISLLATTTDIKQRGNGKISFVGGEIQNSTIDFENASYVSLAAFSSNSETNLSFGNTTDTAQTIYKIQNSTTESNLPHLTYEPNVYENKGTIYHNPGTQDTANGTITGQGPGLSGNASYYIVTGDNTKTSNLRLISDTDTDITSLINIKGWTISKLGNANADLVFTYTNNDGAAYGPNDIMQLDGANNQIILPTATNAPGTTPKLVWGASGANTNIYVSAPNTLKTDGSFIAGTAISGTTLNLATGSAASPSLTFGSSPNSGLYASGADNISISTASSQRMNISATGIVSINSLAPTGVVHNDNSGNLSTSLIADADIIVGTIADNKLSTTVTNAATPNTIVRRDGSGNFSVNAITTPGAIATGAGFFASGAGAGFYATNSATFNGPLIGNASTATSAISFSGSLAGDVVGMQTTTTVVQVGGQLASAVATAAYDVAHAVADPATPNTLVRRDGSGGFTAGTIIATLTGHASQDLLKAGDSMLGTFTAISGTAASPSIQFTGSTNTGFSTPVTNNLAFSTNGIQQMNINPTGVVSLNSLTGADGIVHNSITTGNLTSSLIKNIDVDPAAAIVDTKLAIIATAGKVSNSATTATTASVANTIVQRDNSGSFTSNIITATGGFIGNLSGTASGNLPNSGGTLTGVLSVPAGTAANTSINFGNASVNYGLYSSSATGANVSISAGGAQQISVGSAAVTITPATTFSSTLGVTGVTTLANTLNVTSGATTNLSGPLNVTGAMNVTGAVTFNTTLGVTGVTTLANTLNVTSGATTNLSGPLNVTGAMNVTGAATFASTLTLPASANTAPKLIFSSATGLGISATGSGTGGVLSIETPDAGGAAVERVFVNATGVTIVSPGTLTLPATVAPAPSLNFIGNTNTGLSATGNTLSLNASGVQGLNLSNLSIIRRLPVCDQAVLVWPQLTASGTTATATATTSVLVLSSNASRTVTVAFPPSPVDGQLFTILDINSTTNNFQINITNSVVGPITVTNPVTRLNTNQTMNTTQNGTSVTYIFNLAANTWYRFSRGQ